MACPQVMTRFCIEATWSQSQYLGEHDPHHHVVIMATPIWLMNVSKGMLINAGLRQQSISNFKNNILQGQLSKINWWQSICSISLLSYFQKC